MKQLEFREDDHRIVVSYDNRGEPFREGVSLMFDSDSMGFVRVLLDAEEIQKLIGALTDALGLKVNDPTELRPLSAEAVDGVRYDPLKCGECGNVSHSLRHVRGLSEGRLGGEGGSGTGFSLESHCLKCGALSTLSVTQPKFKANGHICGGWTKDD
jgi:hypothetical protein